MPRVETVEFLLREVPEHLYGIIDVSSNVSDYSTSAARVGQLRNRGVPTLKVLCRTSYLVSGPWTHKLRCVHSPGFFCPAWQGGQ